MKGIFDWVHWFRALSAKIAEVGEQGLSDRALKVDWGVTDPALLRFGAENIEPLSFEYFLSSRNGNHAVFESVHHIFEIDLDLPDKAMPEAWVFPTAMPLRATFYGKDGPKPKLFWRLFRQVQPDEPTLDDDTFRGALEIKGIGVAMLTQAMCLVNPYRFLPIDDFTKPLIGQFPAATILEKPKAKLKATITLHDYMAIMRGTQDVFRECELYEVGRLLYEHGILDVGLISESSRYFHISTRVRGERGPDFWDQFMESNSVFTGGRASGVEFGDSLPANKRPYSIEQPDVGDIVLVRFGISEGRGIGVVVSNDHVKSGPLSAENRIHVLWLNRKCATLPRKTQIKAFGGATIAERGIVTTFSTAEEYRTTFSFLRALGAPTPPLPPPRPESDFQNWAEGQTTYPRNQILYGPPGTGKTWSTTARAVAVIAGWGVKAVEKRGRKRVKAQFDKLRSSGQVEMVTFHQNYAYEDFIEGIRPVVGADADAEVGYELRPGVFRRIAEAATSDKRRFVLIIDEINRGNIARIFGELITLVEESRRIGGSDETKVTLPYSGKEFGVPNNLHIIGTMNTADRSIALLDTALRRRFEFVEMMPKADHEGLSRDVGGVDCQRLLEVMNKRIWFLLDREHQIGHTYLLGVEDIGELREAFQNRIVPLLQEYFYDDWAKIDAVLAGNGFVKTVKCPEELKGKDLVDDDRDAYDVLPFSERVWGEATAYQKIYVGRTENGAVLTDGEQAKGRTEADDG